MQYKDPGYNRLMVGDFYHWESDEYGNILIEENSQKLKHPKSNKM